MEKFLQLTANMTTNQVMIITAFALLIYVCSWYLAAVRKQRSDLADTAWGLGFAFVAWVSFAAGVGTNTGLVVNLLVTIWALRLALHIHKRNRHREEDFRYKNMQKTWGKSFNIRMFFQIFFLQGCILFIVALPILWIHTHPQAISSTVFWAAIVLWVIGFLVEAIADKQLAKFKKHYSHKGKLLMKGLWSVSRHPNYLGELCQWWAIWIFAAPLPLGWALIISPLLLSFLIIQVSGIAPLENKMKRNPDFAQYALLKPPLIPIATANSIIYSLAQYSSIYFGARHSLYIPLSTFIINIIAQMALFRRWDRLSYIISLPLAIYALGIGFVQESFFTYTGILFYPNDTLLPPLWLIYIYPMFSLTLNNSFERLNKNLLLAFAVGGFGSIFSYISGAEAGGVLLTSPLAYPTIFFCWGTSLTVLIILNRKLIALYNLYTVNEDEITVFFDKQCPVCSREMSSLKARKQTGQVIYACPTSDDELKNYTNAFSYKRAMDEIHAIDDKGEILTGTDALAAVYARTDLPLISILLQAPGFRPLFKVIYVIWAKLRPRNVHRS